MSKKNLSFKNLKVKKNIAVIMSMTMSLNCVVAHAGPVKHKRGKNHNKNQQTTSVSDTKHQSPPPAVEKTPTQTEKPKEQPSNQPITKETQTEKKSNFQTASKTQQNQQTNKPDKETQIMAKTQTNEPTKFQFYKYPYFQNKKQQQKMEEITFHIGEDTEILPNFEIPNGQNKEEIVRYDAKTPINKDTNHRAIPLTIKIIDGKPNGLFFNETDQDYLNPTIKSEDFDFFMKAYETIKTMQQLNEICGENNITPDEIKKNFIIARTDNCGGISLIPFPSIDRNMDLNGILIESRDQKLKFVTYVEMQDNNLLPFLLIKDKKENSLKLSPLLTKKILSEPEEIDEYWKNSSVGDSAFFVTKKQLLESNKPIPVDIGIIKKNNLKLQKNIKIENFIEEHTIGYVSSCENRRKRYSHLFHPGDKEYKSLEEHLKEILDFFNNKESELGEKFSLFKGIENNLKKSTYNNDIVDDSCKKTIFKFLLSSEKNFNSAIPLLESYCNNWKEYYKDNILDKHLETLKNIILNIVSMEMPEINRFKLIGSSKEIRSEKNKPKLIATLKEIPFDVFSNYLYKQNLLKISQEKNKTFQLTEEEEKNLLNTNQNIFKKYTTSLNSEKQSSNKTEIKSEQEQTKPFKNKQQKKSHPHFHINAATSLNSEEQSKETEIKTEQNPITKPFAETKNKQQLLNLKEQPPNATTEIKSKQEQIIIKSTENDKQNQKTNPSFNLPVIAPTKFLLTVDDFEKEECKESEENKAHLIDKINNTFLTNFKFNSLKYFNSKKSVRGNFFTFLFDNNIENFLSDCSKNNVVKWTITQEMWQHMLGTGEKSGLQMYCRIGYHVFNDDLKKNHLSHKKELAEISFNNFKKITKYIKGANISNSLIYSIEARENTENNNKLEYFVALLTPILTEENENIYFLCTVWRKSPFNICYIVTAYPMFCINKKYIACDKEVNNIFENLKKAQLNRKNVYCQAPA